MKITQEMKWHLPNLLMAFARCGLLALVVGVAVEYTYYRFVPIDNYVRYESVEVSDISSGKSITFASYADRGPGLHMSWYDTLFCNTSEKWVKLGTQVWDEANLRATSMKTANKWKYTKAMPTSAAKCFLRSAPQINFLYGIVRYLPVIETEVFNIPLK